MKKKILVVEDTVSSQLLIRRQIHHLGYEVDIVNDGQQGLIAWRAGSYGLILTDCQMPKMDGFELTRQIRVEEHDRSNHTPIIALTANAISSDIQICFDCGMDDILTKPSSITKLNDVLVKWGGGPINEATSEGDMPQPQKQEIDLSVLAQYIGDDKEDHRELIQSFLNRAPNAIEQILLDCQSGNINNASAKSHKLKSSASTVGALALAEKLVLIEQSAMANDKGAIREYSESLNELFNNYSEHARAQLKHGLLMKSQPEIKKEAAYSDIKVMVVDDDELILTKMIASLKTIGLSNIEVSQSAGAVLEQLDEGILDVDLMLIDLSMPEMDGITFLRHLAERKFKGGIIIFTGQDLRILKTVSQLTEAHKLKLVGAIKKPVLIEQLRSVIDRYTPLSDEKQDTNIAIKITGADIENALKNGEIKPYYQPQVSAQTMSLIGVEALARWNSPTYGFIGPNIFIPIAEKEGLINQVTEVIYLQSVKQMKKWEKAGLVVPRISVNFSMKSLVRVEIVEHLMQILEDNDLAASSVGIELTESSIEDCMTVVMEILSRLRMHGFALSIDDFGTGYATLEQLQSLPFGELKLDLSYVKNACKDLDALTILKSSVSLAQNLSLETVAEGVEDEETLKLLIALGVDIIQGYYIAKPMSADDLLDWGTSWAEQHTDGADEQYNVLNQGFKQ